MKLIPVDQENNVNKLNQEQSPLEIIRSGRGRSGCPLPDHKWSPLSVQEKRERFADAHRSAQKDNASVPSTEANADSTQIAKQTPGFFNQSVAIVYPQKNTCHPSTSHQEVLSNAELVKQPREKTLESKFSRDSLVPKPTAKNFIKINIQHVHDKSAENARQRLISSSSDTSTRSCGPSRGR